MLLRERPLTPAAKDEYNAVSRGVAQPGSALEWGSSGRWFESSRPDHFIIFHRAGICML